MKTTLERLQTILVKDYKLALEALTPDAYMEDLGIDSLGTAELLFNVEDEFKVVLPPAQVDLSTLADVVAFIDRLVLEQTNAPTAMAALAL